MTEPTIDDYVEEAMEQIRLIIDRSMYHGDKLKGFLELLEDELQIVRFNV